MQRGFPDSGPVSVYSNTLNTDHKIHHYMGRMDFHESCCSMNLSGRKESESVTWRSTAALIGTVKEIRLFMLMMAFVRQDGN